MNEPSFGSILIFGIVLAPLYVTLLGWFFGRPAGLRLPLIGVGFMTGLAVAAWGGMAVFAFLLEDVFF